MNKTIFDKAIKDGYIQTATRMPEKGQNVDWIAPGGENVTNGTYVDGAIWMLPDNVMYVYYKPVLWRPTQKDKIELLQCPFCGYQPKKVGAWIDSVWCEPGEPEYEDNAVQCTGCGFHLEFDVWQKRI